MSVLMPGSSFDILVKEQSKLFAIKWQRNEGTSPIYEYVVDGTHMIESEKQVASATSGIPVLFQCLLDRFPIKSSNLSTIQYCSSIQEQYKENVKRNFGE